MKCFYHYDLDGKCAGHIVYKNEPECDMIPIHYNKDFPIDTINKDEKIYIVDYSIKTKNMEKLLNITENVIWIDHHKTAINEYKNFKHHIIGIRKYGECGAELTFKYFNPGEKIPMFIKYVSDWDLWKFKFGSTTKFFQYGMRSYNCNPKGSIWDSFYYIGDLAIKDVIKSGKIIVNYNKNKFKQTMNFYSYDVNFEGFNCIACNTKESSDLFESVDDIDQYDIMIPYIFDGEKYVVSLYRVEGKNIDVGEIAKKYGGGGNLGAAGFETHSLPFKNNFL